MKRIASIFIALLLMLAALPQAAIGEAEQTHTFDADRVLVYNPLPYRTNANTLYSGTLPSSQQDPETDGKPVFTAGMHNKGKDCSVSVKDADTRDFWILTNLITYQYDKCTFRLAAMGDHCCIWRKVGDGVSFSQEQADAMLEQFESVIYASNTEHFGAFRDIGGDGRLHILTYDMNSTSVCGFFDLYDLYTREEIEQIDPDDADSYNYLPIINVNTRMADQSDVVYCTLAHEFQHLILRSAVLASPANAERLGSEKSIDVWLNEGFSMAAEELAYPGSVAAQGYLEALSRSDKIRVGMSYQHFDATSTDVGAYAQSFLFAVYLRLQCRDTVYRDMLSYWRDTTDYADLCEDKAISLLLDETQISALDGLCEFPASVNERIGTPEGVTLSKLALAYRIAQLVNEDSGLFSIGSYDISVPVYAGTGRQIEGGGALLIECSGSFSIPSDADSGLVFVGIKDDAVSFIYTVPDPEEGFYVIAASYNGWWYAIPAAPASGGILHPITVQPNDDGSIDPQNARGAVFFASRSPEGYRFSCDDEAGTYMLGLPEAREQALCVGEEGAAFAWSRFTGGAARLQADGYFGRAILYGSYQNGFGYFPSGYFYNASFSQPQLLRVNLIRGDANMDGRLTAADAAFVLGSVVGLFYLNAPMRSAADMDGDGIITAVDAVRILRRIVKLES